MNSRTKSGAPQSRGFIRLLSDTSRALIPHAQFSRLGGYWWPYHNRHLRAALVLTLFMGRSKVLRPPRRALVTGGREPSVPEVGLVDKTEEKQ